MSPPPSFRAVVEPRADHAGCSVGGFQHAPTGADLLALLMLLAGLACLRRAR